MKIIFCVSLLGLLLVSGCSTTKNSVADGIVYRKPVKGLSKEVAIARALNVSDVHYDLSLNIGKKHQEFSGKTKIKFDLKDPKKPLTVDFAEGTVSELSVNGSKIEKIPYNDLYITLPNDLLKVGPNTVTVTYSHPYSNSGEGLHRFKDPKDNRFYLYTQFEPYDANKMFPCFDQPDLKATYTMNVEAPSHWQILTSMMESKKTKVGKGRKLWEFPQSALFSTYLISLHAGPYKGWRSRAGKVPLRLFVRRSLAKYVKPQDWFRVTKQGLKYFGKYFAYPYPYIKYDQVIVPEFNAGAMENVAAVTFSERFVKRARKTRDEKLRTASVILHEMAHMWFGNLVTMKWWNDLWLNESFATYMAALALHEATEFKTGWLSFYVRDKQWAYWEDQMVTTHPIEGVVPNTTKAFAQFDGITYGKGASVMKQISYYLTPDKFREGMRIYFKRYANSNTILKEFLGALEAGANTNLEKWSTEWLRTTGVNPVEARFGCKGGKVNVFHLLQHPSTDSGVLRSHKTQVALLRLNKRGKMVVYKKVPVTYSKKETLVPEMVGARCPQMVWTNYQDYDYSKARLDKTTLVNSQKYLSKIQDPLVRAQIWAALWDMVEDGELPVTQYTAIALKHIEKEKDFKALKKVMDKVMNHKKASAYYYLPQSTPEEKKFRDEYLEALEKIAWRQFRKSRGDFKKLWFEGFVNFVATPKGQARLVSMLENKKSYGFKFDQDRRWMALRRLSRLGHARAKYLASIERKRDQTSAGEVAFIGVEASEPLASSKNHWFTEVVRNKNKRPFAHLRELMLRIYPVGHESFKKNKSGEFFRSLDSEVDGRNAHFLEEFVENMVPTVCEGESFNELSQYIDKRKNLPPVVKKQLLIARQEDSRCIRARAVAKAHASGE